jgi:DNA-binding transcriptional LysR family regulator
MLDQLRALAVFAKTADLGSFRAAAKAFALSPSVVSHHVSELERHVGVPLLYRTTRQIALTPEGARLLTNARAMIDAAERGLDELTGTSADAKGTLRFTAPAFFAETRFPRDLGAFARANPGVSLHAQFTDARTDLLAGGLDLALRIGSRDDTSHLSRKLATLHRVVVASPALLEEHPAPKDPHALAAMPIVHLGARAPEVALVPPKKKTAVTHAYTPRITVDSAAAMRELALAGLGVAIVPEVLVRRDVQGKRLVELLPDHRVPELPVYALWPRSAQRATLTARFLAFLAPRFERLFAEG